MEGYLIDEYHKKPYYHVGVSYIMYETLAEKDLRAMGINKFNKDNTSNKIKKHFGFTITHRKIPYGQRWDDQRWESRIEIHNPQKLFAFRLKHGL